MLSISLLYSDCTVLYLLGTVLYYSVPSTEQRLVLYLVGITRGLQILGDLIQNNLGEKKELFKVRSMHKVFYMGSQNQAAYFLREKAL